MQMTRRGFLKTVAAAGVAAGLPSVARSDEAGTKAFRTALYKALIAPVADDTTCERIAKAGFPGMELTKKGVTIGKGSIDWKSIRKAIDEIGYNGWVSIEENAYTDAEYSALMDRFFAGQDVRTGLPS